MIIPSSGGAKNFSMPPNTCKLLRISNKIFSFANSWAARWLSCDAFWLISSKLVFCFSATDRILSKIFSVAGVLNSAAWKALPNDAPNWSGSITPSLKELSKILLISIAPDSNSFTAREISFAKAACSGVVIAVWPFFVAISLALSVKTSFKFSLKFCLKVRLDWSTASNLTDSFCAIFSKSAALLVNSASGPKTVSAILFLNPSPPTPCSLSKLFSLTWNWSKASAKALNVAIARFKDEILLSIIPVYFSFSLLKRAVLSADFFADAIPSSSCCLSIVKLFIGILRIFWKFLISLSAMETRSLIKRERASCSSAFLPCGIKPSKILVNSSL